MTGSFWSRRALGGLLTAAALSLALCPTAAAAPALHVIPFPGTPDASPLSHVIFSSLEPSELKSVRVFGASSGRHLGTITALPDGAGTAFVPTRPFSPGELVSVTAVLRSPAAGTASGDPGATTLRTSFTVAIRASAASTGGQAAAGNRVTPLAGISDTPSSTTQRFHSAPRLHPPLVSASTDADLASGHVFLTPFTPSGINPVQNGLMILDRRGRLVWFHPVRGWAANLEVQRYQKHPVLTWFHQITPTPEGTEDVILNRSYRPVAKLHAAEGYNVDMHEFQLTKQGTAFIDSYSTVTADLSSIGGPKNGAVFDCLIQELDVKTGQLLWEWHALGHVPLAASHSGQPAGWPPYGFFHLNSIQQLPNGNLLISARDTWSLYEIDKQTGRVIWTLGGRYSNFKMGPGTNFEWQHDARLSGHTLSLFDDGALPQEERQSSAKVMRVDTADMTVSLERRYTHSPPVLASVMGSTQILGNHDVFVGWGKQPLFSEYSPSGQQIFSGSMPAGTYSYRAFRFTWDAAPQTRPALAVSRASGSVTVYASWNGATQVASWRIEGGSKPTTLTTLTHVPWRGFETAIDVAHPPRYVAVQALSARGKVLGTSRAVAG